MKILKLNLKNKVLGIVFWKVLFPKDLAIVFFRKRDARCRQRSEKLRHVNISMALCNIKRALNQVYREIKQA